MFGCDIDPRVADLVQFKLILCSTVDAKSTIYNLSFAMARAESGERGVSCATLPTRNTGRMMTAWVRETWSSFPSCYMCFVRTQTTYSSFLDIRQGALTCGSTVALCIRGTLTMSAFLLPMKNVKILSTRPSSVRDMSVKLATHAPEAITSWRVRLTAS